MEDITHPSSRSCTLIRIFYLPQYFSPQTELSHFNMLSRFIDPGLDKVTANSASEPSADKFRIRAMIGPSWCGPSRQTPFTDKDFDGLKMVLFDTEKTNLPDEVRCECLQSVSTCKLYRHYLLRWSAGSKTFTGAGGPRKYEGPRLGGMSAKLNNFNSLILVSNQRVEHGQR